MNGMNKKSGRYKKGGSVTGVDGNNELNDIPLTFDNCS